jgi:hypothetical protein
MTLNFEIAGRGPDAHAKNKKTLLAENCIFPDFRPQRTCWAVGRFADGESFHHRRQRFLAIASTVASKVFGCSLCFSTKGKPKATALLKRSFVNTEPQ